MPYNVTVRNLANVGEEITFECDENKTIRQLCEENNIHITLSENCTKNGECLTCVAKVLEGTVNHPDLDIGTSLDPNHISEGYFSPCIATPTSDCKIVTEQLNQLKKFSNS
jgi:ferredoxin